jgi:hypothetical protein
MVLTNTLDVWVYRFCEISDVQKSTLFGKLNFVLSFDEEGITWFSECC